MGTVSAAAAIATLAIALVTPRGPASAQLPRPSLDSADLGGWLDGLIPTALEEGAVPGAIVVIVKDGRVLFQKGYGFADLARRIPMDPVRTVVSVGSISKLFTWTAVMQQVAAGRLELDGDVNDHLDFTVPATFEEPIRLRHLMTHTAGFEERAFRSYRKPRALAEHLRGTPVPERIDRPGEVVAYSNYGSMLGGHLVELVSGERFVDYLDRHVLGPLGMTRSSFRRPLPPALAADLARSYGGGSAAPLPADALDHEEPSGDPSGHLATTGADIARFMLAHLRNGELDGARILDSATAALMHAPAVEPVPGAHPITLGFFRTDRNGRRIIAHAGDIEAFHADLELLPEEQVGLFVVVNGAGTARGLFGAGHQLRSGMIQWFLDRYFPADPAPEEPSLATGREHARLVAGEYQMSRRGTGDFTELENLLARAAMKLVVRANEDGTIVTPPILDFERGRVRTWREVAPFVWREVGGTERIFMKVEAGRVVAWIPERLFSFVLVPVSAAKAAMPNVILLIGAAAILAGAVLTGAGARVVRWRTGRPAHPVWRPSLIAATIGLGYLLAWALILGSGVPDREGGEAWIRAAQVLGIAALGATILSFYGLWLIRRNGLGGLATIAGVLVVLAMLETTWLSFGFHLLSWRLIF